MRLRVCKPRGLYRKKQHTTAQCVGIIRTPFTFSFMLRCFQVCKQMNSIRTPQCSEHYLNCLNSSPEKCENTSRDLLSLCSLLQL